ncbi:hypothetical protein [Halovivax limisalsi]|uniref:hypothetical protein n=1 Tax=Halovivax limisalsi TaxID=1453760 RepID=UPI001FFD3870|nr:hypothetical protein [Halovivax limisalsi]
MGTRRRSHDAGLGGSFDWLLGGALGGLLGSALFGVVLWLFEPTFVTNIVPALYGIEAGPLVWVFHLAHGIVLGIVFGFLVTRAPVIGALSADVDTGFLAATGLHTRFALAGVVYGLAIWAVLPVIGFRLWTDAGGVGANLPAVGFWALLGHMLYGLLLGALFSLFVGVGRPAAEATAPFEEASPEDRR